MDIIVRHTVDADLIKQIVAGVIVAAIMFALPMRRWSSIDRTLKGVRRDLRRGQRWARRRFRRHAERLDAHDEALARLAPLEIPNGQES